MNRYTVIKYNKEDHIGNCTFLEEAGYKIDSNSNKKRRIAKFRCMCGNEFIASISNVKRGNTTSCGCYNNRKAKETNTKHGLSTHPLYGQWQNIKNRCYNKNILEYKSYGAKGIKVCEEWKNNFMPFYNWAQDNHWELGLQVDRIDGTGNYEPNNCRITTCLQQSRNRKNNINIFLNGKSMCLKDYCAELNVNYNMVRYRFKDLNWSLEKSISTKRRSDIIKKLNG